MALVFHDDYLYIILVVGLLMWSIGQCVFKFRPNLDDSDINLVSNPDRCCILCSHDTENF